MTAIPVAAALVAVATNTLEGCAPSQPFDWDAARASITDIGKLKQQANGGHGGPPSILDLVVGTTGDFVQSALALEATETGVFSAHTFTDF